MYTLISGDELIKQLGDIDIFCAMVGTAGMIMGVSKSLKKANMKTRIVVLEPAESPQPINQDHSVHFCFFCLCPETIRDGRRD